MEVSEEDEFLELELPQLLPLIDNENLNIENEMQVFEATLRYIKHREVESKYVFVEIFFWAIVIFIYS